MATLDSHIVVYYFFRLPGCLKCYECFNQSHQFEENTLDNHAGLIDLQINDLICFFKAIGRIGIIACVKKY